MVAYSFKPRFVAPIRVGLGLIPLDAVKNVALGGFDMINRWSDPSAKAPAPKTQTIRAERRRHARPGDELQLYCGMRQKWCMLIGKARCVEVLPIDIVFAPTERVIIHGFNEGVLYYTEAKRLDLFATNDGFEDWAQMKAFWREEHGDDLIRFNGKIIYWKPIRCDTPPS